MKRRLIDYEVFERIEKDSLSNAQNELNEAAPVLAKALNLECDLNLRCFSGENVIYETCDGSFVHANYKVESGHVEFNNVEQLVINEETEQKKSRKILSDMLDSLIENNELRAEELFGQYMEFPATKRDMLSEQRKLRVVPKRDSDGDITGYGKARWNVNPKKREPNNVTTKRVRSKKIKDKKRSKSNKKLMASRRERVKKTIGEWANLCENVFNYIDYKELGPALQSSLINHDDRGNVVTVRIPTKNTRNEAKMLSFKWKMVEDVAGENRKRAKGMVQEQAFCKAINNLKRQNNLSDNSALQETLDNIVTKWPTVLYVTEQELADQIKLALEMTDAKNFDDQTCQFMAEGILRSAHDAYTSRVAKILKIAGTQANESDEDAYTVFKNAVDKFYPSLDENNVLEMQVFVDLYEAIRGVYDLAGEEENHTLKTEASYHLKELRSIIEQHVDPSLDIAESAADWLIDLVETNLDGGEWNVNNTPHITVSGDHPEMAKKAAHSYTPSRDFSGSWGGTLPVSDGKSYRGGEENEMRNRSWGQAGKGDVFPSLSNPHVPNPFGDYKIKGEKHVDADAGQLAHWGDSNTWPNLQNPYIPSSETPSSYKMNKGREEDLVVDQ